MQKTKKTLNHWSRLFIDEVEEFKKTGKEKCKIRMDLIMDEVQNNNLWAEWIQTLENNSFVIEKELKELKLWK